MDEPNKNQTWLYDTPGIISENQVWHEWVLSSLETSLLFLPVVYMYIELFHVVSSAWGSTKSDKLFMY